MLWCLWFCLVLAACSWGEKPLPPLMRARYLEPHEFSLVLGSPPSGKTVDGLPNGNVAVVCYGQFNNAPHLLLVRDSRDGRYGAFAGPMLNEADKPETLEQAIMRVGADQSAGLVALTPEGLNQAKVYMAEDRQNTAWVFAFVAVKRTWRMKDLTDAQNDCKTAACKQVDGMVWVPVRLVLSLPTGASDFTFDNAQAIKLKPSLVHHMGQIPFRKVLMDIERRE